MKIKDKTTTYKDAGVSRELGDQFVERLQKKVGLTHNADVVSGIGGFAALYKISEDRLLAASTDGVGTKIKLALELGLHDTIGVDLVAMCVNDLICTGARPLFFLDYFASAQLDLKVAEQVMDGIIRGCQQSSMALIGGETAEMPGIYQPGEYDLAGFAVGEVNRDQVFTGEKIQAGQSLVGIHSTGFHSNGYSLVRKLLKQMEAPRSLKEKVLTPTQIYVPVVAQLLETMRPEIMGFANMTGSGVLNIPRLNDQFDYVIDSWPKTDELPAGMKEVIQFAEEEMKTEELFTTFNMGIGFVIATSNPEKCLGLLTQFRIPAQRIGSIVQKGSVSAETKNLDGVFLNLNK